MHLVTCSCRSPLEEALLLVLKLPLAANLLQSPFALLGECLLSFSPAKEKVRGRAGRRWRDQLPAAVPRKPLNLETTQAPSGLLGAQPFLGARPFLGHRSGSIRTLQGAAGLNES